MNSLTQEVVRATTRLAPAWMLAVFVCACGADNPHGGLRDGPALSLGASAQALTRAQLEARIGQLQAEVAADEQLKQADDELIASLKAQLREAETRAAATLQRIAADNAEIAHLTEQLQALPPDPGPGEPGPGEPGPGDPDPSDPGPDPLAECGRQGRAMNAPYANSNESGIDGSSSSLAFLICTAEQLNQIGLRSADWDKHFKLGAVLDMGELDEPYHVIGTIPQQFTGTFDGQFHAIYNLRIEGDSNVGLFGVVGDGATIRHTVIREANIAGRRSVGVLAGNIQGGVVSQTSVRGDITTMGTARSIGGLAGHSNGWIEDSHANVHISSDVEGGRYFGGLVGSNNGVVQKCFAHGNVITRSDYVGGLIGRNTVGAQTNLNLWGNFSTGNVQGKGRFYRIGSYAGLVVNYNVANIFVASTAECVNLNPLEDCHQPVAEVVDVTAEPTYFHRKENAPLHLWDFDEIWRERDGEFPVLKRE